MRVRHLTAAVACASLIIPPPAAATSSGSPLGFAVAAVGTNSYFVFHTRAGAAVHGALRVINLGSIPRTILLTSVDVSTASAGGLQYGDGSPRGDGRWVSLGAGRLRLPRYGSMDVPFTLRVPKRARPGDHFAGVVAVDQRVLEQKAVGDGAIRLRIIPRLAMTIQVRLPGPLRTSLALGGIGIAVAPSGASLALQISNPADTLITSTTGTLTVSQGSNPLFSQATQLAAFVPRTAITFHVPWEGKPVEGTYRVNGELRPAGAPPILFDRTVTFGRSAIRQYRRQTGRPATVSAGTPGLLIAGLALAAGAAAGFGAAYAGARKRLQSRS